MTTKERAAFFSKVQNRAMKRLVHEFYYEYRKFWQEEVEKLTHELENQNDSAS